MNSTLEGKMPGNNMVWTSDSDFLIGDTAFHATIDADVYHKRISDENSFLLVKSRAMVEAIISASDPSLTKTIVDIGIWQGGSVALFDQVYQPEKLVALEYSDRELPPLDAYIERKRRHENVRIFKGVNQGDSAKVSAILDAEFGDRTIDLVVDDASHYFEETRTSFNCIFPRVSPDGIFIIEDWQWSTNDTHHKLDYFAGKLGLANLVALCMVACGSHPDIVSSVLVSSTAAIIRRGSAVLDPGSFDVTDLAKVHGRPLPLVM